MEFIRASGLILSMMTNEHPNVLALLNIMVIILFRIAKTPVIGIQVFIFPFNLSDFQIVNPK